MVGLWVGMLILFLFLLVVFMMSQGVKTEYRPRNIMVSRSTPKTYSSNYIECGNCRGTGLDGFGIMPDSFECEACGGKGSHKIDPNAKYVSLSELAEKYRSED